jgi:hypothetical protein
VPAIVTKLVNLLVDMPSFSEFYLLHNAMRGVAMPSELGAMKSLTRLVISDNYFQGSIPSELGCLTNLTDLSIFESRDFMDTSIPQEVLALQHTNAKLDITFV